MGMEQEIKLRAADAATLDAILQDDAVCSRRMGEMESVRMNTIYFDTEDHLLASRKWVLRYRTENDDTVITLKTPADGNHIRGEWELTGNELVHGDVVSPHVYRALFSQGAPQAILNLEGRTLQTVCGVQFLRRRCKLQLGDTVAELALDLGTLHRGGRTGPLIEVELELIRGDFADVEAFARELSDRYALREEPLSKYQQTMRM